LRICTPRLEGLESHEKGGGNNGRAHTTTRGYICAVCRATRHLEILEFIISGLFPMIRALIWGLEGMSMGPQGFGKHPFAWVTR
jgi:hypothetical protein